MRWGACAQEICFANDFLSTFFGAGKALPVRRGNGVMQHNWTTLAEQVRKGHWVHVFPEAAVYQTGYVLRFLALESMVYLDLNSFIYFLVVG